MEYFDLGRKRSSARGAESSLLQEKPLMIVDEEECVLQMKTIYTIKLEWQHHMGYTWKPKVDLQTRYPQLFAQTYEISRTKFS
ncbi:hypothetical protein EJ110_NYTH25423 [Nymphaea thermarum]|nr:hypothetical protein EJ110_NYTH25423 [Nymphaea thermarum]